MPSINHWSAWQVTSIAQIQCVVSTGQLAELFHQGQLWINVKVDPHDPTWVILMCEMKIFLNSLEVTSLHFYSESFCYVEGEGHDFLSRTTLKCITTARGVLQINWFRIFFFQKVFMSNCLRNSADAAAMLHLGFYICLIFLYLWAALGTNNSCISSISNKQAQVLNFGKVQNTKQWLHIKNACLFYKQVYITNKCKFRTCITYI